MAMNKQTLSLSLAFVFLFVTTFIFSQQNILTNYSLDDGIPQSSILSTYQDIDGNIWFGTQGGVSKFNGHDFENFDSRHGLNGNHITDILQDKSGRYWFGHRYKGLTVLENKIFITLDLTDKRINCFAEDNQGNVWIGTFGKGLFLLPVGKEVSIENILKVPISADSEFYTVYDLISMDNYMLIASELGVLQVEFNPDISSFNLSVHNPENSYLPIQEIFSFTHSESALWAMGEYGLIKMDKSQDDLFSGIEYFPFNKHMDIYFLSNIIIDKENTLWGVHDMGTYRFKDGVFDYDFYGTGYSRNKTNNVFCDKEGNVWIGTMNLGVFKYSGDKFIAYNTESGMLNNVVVSVIEDKQGNVWAATENGISKYNGTNYEYLTTENGLPSNSVQVIFEDSKGYVWIGFFSEDKLLRYNPETDKFKAFREEDGMITSSVLTIAEDMNGCVWFATLGIGVSKYTYPAEQGPGTFETFTMDDGLCSNSFWIIHADAEKNLWFGSDNGGLTKYDGRMFHSYNEKDGLTNMSPGAITHDSKNNLWIGSIGGGIYKFDGQKFTNFSLDEGLSSDSPFSIICDDKDMVWIGTNYGIDRFDPVHETFKHYDCEDGFLGIENNQNSIYKSEEGIIWFGTMNGVIRFDPSKDLMNLVPPLTKIENIQLFFNDFDYSMHTDNLNKFSGLPANMEFNYKQNHLTFESIGISHTAADNVKYKYKLENFDDDWNPVTKATSITYTNVPPGEYVFKVKSCNNDGIWNLDPVELAFKIYSPFWSTWWFRVLAVFIAAGMIYGYFTYRFKSIKAQKLKLENQVDKKTLELKHEAQERKAAQIRAEESDKLKTAFLANMSHEIRTPVNAIVGFSDLLRDPELNLNDRDLYLDYITNGGKALLTLINDIIDISKIEAGQVRIAKEGCSLESIMMELYMMFGEEIKKKGKSKIELKIEQATQTRKMAVITDPYRLKQVMSNLISNAIKFTNSGSIEFGYKVQDEDNLLFFVKDTGIGIPEDKTEIIFHRFRQIEDAFTKNYYGTGLGLAISKKLTSLMGGEMWVESVSGEGSVFYFTLPFETAGSKEQYLETDHGAVFNESLKGKSILVVEDEDSNYLLIENMLKGYDMKIIRAADGITAVDVFKKNGRTIDLVLMDIKIPGINGYEATKQIKKIKSMVPVIAQTAYALTSEKENCIEAGCDDYISKPYNKQELLSVMQKNLTACHSYY